MLPQVTDLLHLYFVVQVQTLERLASLRRLHRAERRELWQRDNVLVWASAGGVDQADAPEGWVGAGGHEPRNKPRLVALLRVLFESRPRHLPEVFLHAVALPADTLQERGPAL